MEGAHDLGGVSGFGAVRTSRSDDTHDEGWELRAQLLALMACRGARAWIERIDTPTYLTSSYYERWLLGAELGAVANQFVTSVELVEWRRRIEHGELPERVEVESLRARVEQFMTTAAPMPPATTPIFAACDLVRVRRVYLPDVHHRIPRYVRGVVGTVETVCGDERVAGHRDNDFEPLYTVRFSSVDVWGESTSEPPFSLHVDLWQSYLERAT